MHNCPVWGAFQHDSGALNSCDHECLTLALFARLSQQYAAMVDATKTAWGSFFMPFQLQKKLGARFLLVHLVRDPRAVCWSMIRTTYRHKDTRFTSTPLIRCLRTTIGWLSANAVCEVFSLRHPRQYLRLRYEDLTCDPQAAVRDVLQKASLQPPAGFELADIWGNRHQLYGNSMRFKPLTLQQVRQDVAWGSDMPKVLRSLAIRLCWPLSAKYGYHG